MNAADRGDRWVGGAEAIVPDRPLSARSGLATECVDSPQTDPNLAAVPSDGPEFDPLTSTAPLTPIKAEPDAEPRLPPVRTTLHPGVLLDRRYQLQRHISDRGD